MIAFPALLVACFISLAASAADGPQKADFGSERASPEVKHIADWVVHSRDNHADDDRRLPFVILDKTDARIYLFDAQGNLLAAAPALLGLGKGDTSFDGIGQRKLSTIRPEDRTTPAGRFVGFMGDAFIQPKRAEDVLWVDYNGAVAIHRVVKSANRLLRLASPTPLDNRISFGCINVPVKFFEDAVRPAFKGAKGIIYVLPETKTAREVFTSYDVPAN